MIIKDKKKLLIDYYRDRFFCFDFDLRVRNGVTVEFKGHQESHSMLTISKENYSLITYYLST